MALRIREILVVLAMLVVGLVFYAWLFDLI
jgi:hypothetical protein